MITPALQKNIPYHISQRILHCSHQSYPQYPGEGGFFYAVLRKTQRG